MPPNTVSVARPHEFGNPWRVGRDGDAAHCVAEFRRCLTGKRVMAWPLADDDKERALYLPSDDYVAEILRGKNLACWCPLDQPCHADVLLELANR
jgi:hypothetical protein